MQGGRGAQGARAARRRLRHGPRRHRQPLDPVPEREQLGAGHRRLHAGGRARPRLEPHARSRPARCCRRCGPATCSARSPAAAWECADPGMQFDTTINRWHTAANTGRINGSNPCFTADTRVHTDKGLIRFAELFDRANKGEEFGVYTHDITNPDAPSAQVLVTHARGVHDHRAATRSCGFASTTAWSCAARPATRSSRTNRGYVEAQDLTADDQVRTLDLPTPRRAPPSGRSPSPPIRAHTARRAITRASCACPAKWSEELGSLPRLARRRRLDRGRDDRDDLRVGRRPHRDPPGAHASCSPGSTAIARSSSREQANGTAQLRLGRRQFKQLLEALGVASVTGEHKTVPWSIEQAPPDDRRGVPPRPVRRRRHCGRRTRRRAATSGSARSRSSFFAVHSDC